MEACEYLYRGCKNNDHLLDSLDTLLTCAALYRNFPALNILNEIIINIFRLLIK
jgi:hypothetical protein